MISKVDEHELKKMEKIYEVFKDYIAESPNIEVLRSDKLGFIVIDINDETDEFLGADVVDTAKNLCHELFKQVTEDVFYSFSDSPDNLWELPESRRQVIRSALAKYSAALPEYEYMVEEMFKESMREKETD